MFNFAIVWALIFDQAWLFIFFSSTLEKPFNIDRPLILTFGFPSLYLLVQIK